MPFSLARHHATSFTVEDEAGHRFEFEVVLSKRRWPALERRGTGVTAVVEAEAPELCEQATTFARECAARLGLLTAARRMPLSNAS